MSSKISEFLEQRFAQNRVVFWHDPAIEYEDDLRQLDLDQVEVLKVSGNEFGVKAQILTNPESKFLVYRPGEIPARTENWLLDLELAYGVFTADKTSLLQQELGSDNPELANVIADYPKFFESAVRKKALHDLLSNSDTEDIIKAKMCQILVKAQDKKLSNIVREILIEYSSGNDEKDKLAVLEKNGLAEFFWHGVASIYGYEESEPNIDGFVLWTFKNAFDNFISDDPYEYQNIRSDFNVLRYDTRTKDVIKRLASVCSSPLQVSQKVEKLTLDELIYHDIFEEVDQAIIVRIIAAVIDNSLKQKEIAEICVKRHECLWHEDFAATYDAVQAASVLFASISQLPESIATLDEGLDEYQKNWYRIDRSYRKFTLAFNESNQQEALVLLKQEVDKRYANKYLYQFGTVWQQAVDHSNRWDSARIPSQKDFYQRFVADAGTKVVVVISDALRYEIAAELGSRVRSTDKYEAVLSAQLGVLPSYTQLGMAALLPHKELELTATGLPVNVDGQSSAGIVNRDKILKRVGGCAVSATDILNFATDELRKLISEHQVIYIYHNVVDETGDSVTSEAKVFAAAEEAQEDLLKIIKKMINNNASNIIVTADHGFIYQDNGLEPAYYLSEQPQGDQITKINHRYVLGKNLRPAAAFTTYTAAQLGLEGGVDVQIPKSIHRIKVKGSGTRYVHGGASLAEIVVPVLKVNKRRISDTRMVEVQLINNQEKITTGQISVIVAQSEPVSDKVHPRRVRFGIYAGETLISNQPTLYFDSRAEDPRDRQQKTTLYLTSDAEQFNNTSVELRLESEVPNKQWWEVFSKTAFALKRSFSMDFDF